MTIKRKSRPNIKEGIIQVGIFDYRDNRTYSKGGSNIGNIELGWIHEKGTKTIPARPFISSVLKRRHQAIKSFIKKNLMKPNFYSSLGRLGLSLVHEGFRTKGFGKWKATGRKNPPLRDTRQLINSIKFRNKPE